MLESILIEEGTNVLSLDIVGMIICSIAALVLGFIIAISYMLCTEKYSRGFVISITLLPVLVQMVIMMVNGNLGTGVAIVGAFSLVRFRSVPGNSKEIVTVFFTMAVGLATGMGYVVYAGIFTVLVAAVFIILSKTGFGSKKDDTRQLKIVIPENLNYAGLFDDILAKYTSQAKLERAKTTNLGSMFELIYRVDFKKNADEKSMIDEIRTRNGNLTVSIGTVEKEMLEL